MPKITIRLDKEFAAGLDEATRLRGMTRSAVVREALREAIFRPEESELERKHRAGYEHYPVRPGEFDLWEAEQVWPD